MSCAFVAAGEVETDRLRDAGVTDEAAGSGIEPIAFIPGDDGASVRKTGGDA